MSNTPSHGGPAFPRSAFTPGSSFHNNAAEAGFASTACDGMSLRDYFAAAALTGWCATRSQVDGVPLNSSPEHCEVMAQTCYGFADAMLAERAKEAKP